MKKKGLQSSTIPFATDAVKAVNRKTFRDHVPNSPAFSVSYETRLSPTGKFINGYAAAIKEIV